MVGISSPVGGASTSIVDDPPIGDGMGAAGGTSSPLPYSSNELGSDTSCPTDTFEVSESVLNHEVGVGP